ncbi:MAG: hypothetical protein U5N55_07805 [Cypionkella sp.]|nr:hypothetical protein [Cypionkella sp.]
MTVEDVLKSLDNLCSKHGLEAQVIWATDGDWQPQDGADNELDGEEIVFYAAGMVQEGYRCAWQILGQGAPEFVRLFFWQGEMPPLPADPDLISQGMA